MHFAGIGIALKSDPLQNISNTLYVIIFPARVKMAYGHAPGERGQPEE
jgi:hypothetical protein